MYGSTACEHEEGTEAIERARRQAVGDHDEVPWALSIVFVVVLVSYTYVCLNCLNFSGQVDKLAVRTYRFINITQVVEDKVQHDMESAANDGERAMKELVQQLLTQLDATKLAAQGLQGTRSRMIFEVHNSAEKSLQKMEGKVLKEVESQLKVTLSQLLSHAHYIETLAQNAPVVMKRPLATRAYMKHFTDSLDATVFGVKLLVQRFLPHRGSNVILRLSAVQAAVKRFDNVQEKLFNSVESINSALRRMSRKFMELAGIVRNISELSLAPGSDHLKAVASIPQEAVRSACMLVNDEIDVLKDYIENISHSLIGTVMPSVREAVAGASQQVEAIDVSIRSAGMSIRTGLESVALVYRWMFCSSASAAICLSLLCCIYAFYLEFVWENECIAGAFAGTPVRRQRCLCCHMDDLLQSSCIWALIWAQDLMSVAMAILAILLSVVAVLQVSVASACDSLPLMSNDTMCTDTFHDMNSYAGVDLLRSPRCSTADLLICDGFGVDQTTILVSLLAAFLGPLASSFIPRKLLIAWLSAQNSVETAHLLRLWESERRDFLKPVSPGLADSAEQECGAV